VDLARRQLATFAAAHPGCQQRILVLSDGADTKSAEQPWAVARACQASGVVVDAVSIGDAPADDDPFKGLVAATGGLAFRPTSLHDAPRLCELETVQALAARPPVPSAPQLPPQRPGVSPALTSARALAALARARAYDDIDFTQGRAEPLLALPVDSLARAAARAGAAGAALAAAAADSNRGSVGGPAAAAAAAASAAGSAASSGAAAASSDADADACCCSLSCEAFCGSRTQT